MIEYTGSLLSGLDLLRNDEGAMRAFREVAERIGAAGWEVAKRLDLRPELTEDALRKLEQGGIIRTTQPGLDGNYSLTSLGFTLKEEVFGRRR